MEIDQQHQHDIYKDIDNGKPPKDYKKIRAHFVFDVKHDGRDKARIASDGNLTDVPLSSVYSDLGSFIGIRIVLFLSEPNVLEPRGTCIGKYYLEAFTKEKVCIVAGPAFRTLEGHNIIIVKALYGLRTSGLSLHERLDYCLRDMAFELCMMEPAIYLFPHGEDHYEHIAVYVDDLLITSKDPKSTIDILTNKNSFKLKGTGPIS